MENPLFHWDDETGEALCVLWFNGRNFVGTAQCDEEDMADFKSEKVGCEIAFARAEIKAMVFLRDMELRPQIKALRHLLACIKQSSHHNENSYEFQALRREIRRLENQLDAVNQDLVELKQNLKDYIEMKNTFHKELREKRKKAKDN